MQNQENINKKQKKTIIVINFQLKTYLFISLVTVPDSFIEVTFY